MKRGIIFILLLVLILSLVGCGNEAASIGIIGGADGPTAVFITSGTNWLNVFSILGVIAVAIFVAVLISRNKKK